MSTAKEIEAAIPKLVQQDWRNCDRRIDAFVRRSEFI
jgi:hypothetical protein